MRERPAGNDDYDQHLFAQLRKWHEKGATALTTAYEHRVCDFVPVFSGLNDGQQPNTYISTPDMTRLRHRLSHLACDHEDPHSWLDGSGPESICLMCATAGRAVLALASSSLRPRVLKNDDATWLFFFEAGGLVDLLFRTCMPLLSKVV